MTEKCQIEFHIGDTESSTVRYCLTHGEIVNNTNNDKCTVGKTLAAVDEKLKNFQFSFDEVVSATYYRDFLVIVTKRGRIFRCAHVGMTAKFTINYEGEIPLNDFR